MEEGGDGGGGYNLLKEQVQQLMHEIWMRIFLVYVCEREKERDVGPIEIQKMRS